MTHRTPSALAPAATSTSPAMSCPNGWKRRG
jgi:hypothetical protein